MSKRISKLEEEKLELSGDREEAEATNRAEVDSLRGDEQSVRTVTQEIMRSGRAWSVVWCLASEARSLC